ncbi:MAG: methyltransferase domain-containing protein [Dehalococcoidales bacterium]|nr:methyltransferase domain-containing protein [Dehalococcoidales bacterium]
MSGNFNSFDRWALTYDKDMEMANDSNDWMFGGYYGVLNKVVEYCELEKYENPLMLDIGAGTGNLSVKFLDIGLMVKAIDPSKKMREICQSKYPDLKVLRGDFLDIPLPPESIDIIVSSYAFHHLTPDEKEISISLMEKLLKPKGRIVIADLMFKNTIEEERINLALFNSVLGDTIDEDEYPAIFEDIGQVFQKKSFDFNGEQLTDSVWILCGRL